LKKRSSAEKAHAEKHTRRHSKSTRKQVQGIREQEARKHYTLSQAPQAGWQTHKRRQGTGRQVQSTHKQEGHAVQASGQSKYDPLEWWMLSRTNAVWGSSRGSWPKTWSFSRTCQAHNRFPRPWLQNVSAHSMFD